MRGHPGPDLSPEEELARFVARLQRLRAALVRLQEHHDDLRAEIDEKAIEIDRLEHPEVGEALGRIVKARLGRRDRTFLVQTIC